jgi:hypothetical protein
VKGINFGACPELVPEKFNIKPPIVMVGKSLNTMILINKAQYYRRISRREFWFS